MNREKIEEALKKEYEFAAKTVLQYGARMAAIPKLRAVLEALLSLPQAADVQYVYLGSTWDKGQPRIHLVLREKNSSLVQEAAKLLSVKFVKEPSGSGLNCHAVLNDVVLDIDNYLPPSCRVEYVEKFVPGRLEKRAKVICNEEE